MQVGIFGFESKVDKIVEEVAIAAGQGFASFWVPQIFGVDAITALGVVAREVPDLKFATAVIPTYPPAFFPFPVSQVLKRNYNYCA